jgi:hypothetical protein
VTATTNDALFTLVVNDVRDDAECEEEEEPEEQPDPVDCPITACETSQYYYELLERFVEYLQGDGVVDDIEPDPTAEHGGVTVEHHGGGGGPS